MDKAFKIAVMLSAYDKLSTVVNLAVDKSQRKLKAFQKFSEKTDKGNIIGAAGVDFLKNTIDAAEESEVAEKRLKQVFKSMGEQNDIAATKALSYANTLQMQIGVEDEVIAATQAKIATFKSVSNEAGRMAGIFDRATAAAFDMQATGFGDAASNAVQLGKALEDPVKGITALRRAGITFTDAEKKKIATLVNGNKKLEAQKIVLAAIEHQVGGVAKSTATATGKTKVAWSEVMETIGKKLLPIVNRFANFLTNVLIPGVNQFIERNPMLVKILAAVAIALVTVGTAAKGLSFILATNPITLIIAAIAAAAFLIYKNWGAIKKWFANLWENIKNIFKKTWEWIKHMFLNYTPQGLIIKNWSKIIAWFKNLWENVKNIFSNVWEWIKNMFFKYHPAGIIYKHWDEIVEYFTRIWEKVKNVFKNAWAGLKSGIKSFFGMGGDVDKAIQAQSAVLTKNVNINAQQLSGKTGAMQNALGVNAASSLLQPVPVTNNKSINSFAPVINYSGPGGTAAGQQLGADVVKAMKDYEANKKRTQF